MRDVQKLRELLERCEKASGPDTELDAAILMAFDPEGEPAKIMSGFFKDVEWELAHGGLSYRTENGGGAIPIPRYTALIDASIALVERMLPGWGVGFDKRAEFRPIAWVRPNDQRSGADEFRPAATAPLAVLSALLRALISQAEGEANNA